MKFIFPSRKFKKLGQNLDEMKAHSQITHFLNYYIFDCWYIKTSIKRKIKSKK